MDMIRKSVSALNVPPFGVSLDNSLTHQIGQVSPNGPIVSRRFGYVAPWLRTRSKAYAKLTNGRIDKKAFTAEVPFRQEFKAGNPQIIVTSPGKNPNNPQVTAQEVLYLQALRKRGFL